MNTWLAIALILNVASVYLFVIEIFSVALRLTGLSTSKVHFQVASLFTGTGFTTQESEVIVNDARRRKIALACVYTGHIFSVVIMGLFINVFFSIMSAIGSDQVTPRWIMIVFFISVGFFAIMLLLKIPPINRRFQKLLETIAINSSKKNKNTNIMTVIDVHGKFAIAEVLLNIIPESMKEKPLCKMGLRDYSLNILSIKRGSRMVEVTKDTMFNKGDILVIYGLASDIRIAFINSVSKQKVEEVVDETNDITILNNYGDTALVEVYVKEVPLELENTMIKDTHLTDRYNITIGMIKRGDGYITSNRDTIIQKDDTLTLFGPYKNIKHLFNNSDHEKSEDKE